MFGFGQTNVVWFKFEVPTNQNVLEQGTLLRNSSIMFYSPWHSILYLCPDICLWQCPGGEILPIRIKLVILRNNSMSLVECPVINSGSEIPCHKLASISTKFRVINFMTRDSRHGIKILWKFSKKSLHWGLWGEKIKLSKNPCMGTLRGHIRRCSCKGDNFFWKLLPKTLSVRFLHNKIVLGILEIFFVLRIFFWK